MIAALAPLTRALAPVAESALQGVAQGAGQQLAENGANAIKNLMGGGQPEGTAIAYGGEQTEQKPATY